MSDTDEFARPSHVDEQMWCPVCQPDRPGSPSVGPHVSYCARHRPDEAGVDDDAVVRMVMLSGSGMAEGSDCRAFAALIRRR